MDEDQDDFINRYETYIIKRSQATHLLENVIIDATLRSHGYNLGNRNLKILMDTLATVWTKASVANGLSISISVNR